MLRGKHYDTGHIKIGGKTSGDKLYNFRRWLRDMVRMHQPAVIAYELPFIGVNSNTVGVLYKYHGVFDETLSKFIGVIEPVHISTWKSQICCRKIAKADKENGVVLNILSGHGFAVGQIDEGDAMCVALCVRKKLFGIIK